MDFTDQLLELPLINMTREYFFFGIPEMLNFCYSHKKDKLTPRYKRTCVIFKLKK